MGGNGATSWSQALRRRWPWRRRARGFEPGVGPGSLSEMPGIQIGGYPLVRTFAHGALGELHLASDPDTGAPVAIKTVRLHGGDLTRDRFVRESQAAAKLQHPAIVQFHATGIEGHGEEAVGWIAMEWVAGSDLARYTCAARLLPEPLVLELMAQAAEALSHAHRHGVVHRDIKPANLLFNPARSSLKIADFGCAHLTDAERSRSGVLAGTPVYMAPEQLAGAPVDGRCDLYALGVVLFELLTGHLPFESSSMGELLRAITSQPPPSLQRLRPDLPAALDELLARLLAKPPADRPSDGGVLARELRHVAAALEPTLVSPGAPATMATGTMD
jgi:eukaryotic-like serine/threonine-protein kinase